MMAELLTRLSEKISPRQIITLNRETKQRTEKEK